MLFSMRTVFLLAVSMPGAILAQATDRETAEWMIRLGGRVFLNESRSPIAELSQLPAGDWRITGADLTGTLLDPKDLSKLSGLTELRELYLPGPIWNPGAGSTLNANAQLAALATLRKLEKLHFSLHFLTNVNVRDEGMKLLAPLTQLKELRCSMCRVSQDTLAPFVNLEALDLSYSMATDKTVASLAGMSKLKRLSLRDTLITDAALETVAKLTQIEDLDLYGTRITDAGFARLASLTGLRKLNVLGADLTDASVAVLTRMPELFELNLYRSRITNAGLSRLAGLKHLRDLDVRYSKVSATGVAALRKALPACRVEFAGAAAGAAAESRPQGTSPAALASWIEKIGGRIRREGARIAEVDLSGARVGDAAVAAIAAIPGITVLNLTATEAGDVALDAIAHMTSLRRLVLDHTVVSDAGLKKLKALPALEELSAANTDVRGAALADLPATLRRLDLTGSPVTGESLAALTRFAALEDLRLAQTDITNESMKHVAGLASLKRLDLRGTDVGDAGFAHVGQLANLETLLITDLRFSTKGLEALRPLKKLRHFDASRTVVAARHADLIAAFAELEVLRLDYTTIDDAGVAKFQALSGLRELSLDSASLTDGAIPALSAMKGLKRLNLYHTMVTEEGHRKLRDALPQAEIVWDRDSSLPNRRRS